MNNEKPPYRLQNHSKDRSSGIHREKNDASSGSLNTSEENHLAPAANHVPDAPLFTETDIGPQNNHKNSSSMQNQAAAKKQENKAASEKIVKPKPRVTVKQKNLAKNTPKTQKPAAPKKSRTKTSKKTLPKPAAKTSF